MIIKNRSGKPLLELERTRDHLEGVVIENANLPEADLRGADLYEAYLPGQTLRAPIFALPIFVGQLSGKPTCKVLICVELIFLPITSIMPRICAEPTSRVRYLRTLTCMERCSVRLQFGRMDTLPIPKLKTMNDRMFDSWRKIPFALINKIARGSILSLVDSSTMSTFVLVHGAWQSSGTWDLLTPLLQRHGHAVVTPILRGLGIDQAHLTSEVALHQHVEDVSTALATVADKAVLVGHSYAGMVISGAVELSPTKVKALVFLDAFIPEDGQCALDLLPPQICSFFRNVAQERGDGWRLPGGESQLDLWGLKPGEARDFVRERLCDFSLRCFEEPLPLRENYRARIPATFVSCVAEGYPARPFFEPFAKKALTYGWRVSEVNTGHDCHVESPTEVANILLSAAAAS